MLKTLADVVNDPFIITIGQYTVPSVSGQCFPPTNSFTIDKINHTKGIIFGGVVAFDDIMDTSTNSVYIFNVTHKTIVSYYYSITLSHTNCVLYIIFA